jgi:hypothetical protein
MTNPHPRYFKIAGLDTVNCPDYLQLYTFVRPVSSGSAAFSIRIYWRVITSPLASLQPELLVINHRYSWLERGVQRRWGLRPLSYSFPLSNILEIRH